MSDGGRTGDTTETLEMDWPHFPKASRKHYTTSPNLELTGEKETTTTEKYGAAIWKQRSKKRNTAGDNWRA